MRLSSILLLALCLLAVVAAASPSPPSTGLSFDDLAANEGDATPTPAPSVTNDLRKILRNVDTIPCAEAARHTIFALFFESTQALHDRCVDETGYRFFPYTGQLPTAEQILAIVKSTRCMELYSGVVLADLPECDIDYVSARSAAEVYLRIKKDVDEGRASPSQDEFYELYNLNRVVNLVATNASLVEEAFRESTTPTSVSVAELTRLRTPVVPLPNVRLGDHFKILTDDDDASTKGSAATSTTASGSSSGADNLRSTPPPAPSTETASPTRTSSVAPRASQGHLWLVPATAVAALALQEIPLHM